MSPVVATNEDRRTCRSKNKIDVLVPVAIFGQELWEILPVQSTLLYVKNVDIVKVFVILL